MSNKGRPISKKMQPIHKAVEHYAMNNDRFSIEDVRKHTKKRKADIRAALVRLQRKGKIEITGSQKLSGRGRPRKVYQAVRTHTG